ncbi:MAG: ATP-binding protein [Acidimicrobiia bacterium]
MSRPGIGLGLPLARALAEAHGGSLVYAPGEGATFQLTLPA